MNQFKEFIEYLLNAIKIWIIIQPWEQGLRVRLGKKVKILSKGIYFRIPYIDSVYVQSNRLRVVSMPMQTLTTKDNLAVTITAALGYSITDLEVLYKKLYHPELTMSNMAMSVVADFVYKTNSVDLTPESIEVAVLEKLTSENYGLLIEYFRLTNFAAVKTFRLIQDNSWVDTGIELNKKS